MPFNLAPLLIHSDAVPGRVRQALIRATTATPERRQAELEAAARLLFADTGLECSEVRDLVGLPDSASCA